MLGDELPQDKAYRLLCDIYQSRRLTEHVPIHLYLPFSSGKPAGQTLHADLRRSCICHANIWLPTCIMSDALASDGIFSRWEVSTSRESLQERKLQVGNTLTLAPSLYDPSSVCFCFWGGFISIQYYVYCGDFNAIFGLGTITIFESGYIHEVHRMWGRL